MDNKVYVVYGSEHDSSWTDLEYTKNFDEASVVVFTGGQDINPALYNEPCGSRTGYTVERDAFEVHWLRKAIAQGKLVVGICRGAQLFSAIANGKLIQDVSNHAGFGRHDITFNDGDIIKVMSLHHQMMWPYNLPEEEYDMLAWSTVNMSKRYLDGYDEEMILPDEFVEPEVVYFKTIRGLAVQSHP